MDIPYKDIDERLRPLIKRLNEMGFYTSGSCQGADFDSIEEYKSYKDNDGSHHQQAYIQFYDFRYIPEDLKDIIDLNKKLIFTYFFENEEDTRCEVQSVSMLLNDEFHKEFHSILDEWEKQK